MRIEGFTVSGGKKPSCSFAGLICITGCVWCQKVKGLHIFMSLYCEYLQAVFNNNMTICHCLRIVCSNRLCFLDLKG